MMMALLVNAAGRHPDHTAISEFRRIHLEALAGLFVQVGNVALEEEAAQGPGECR
jgi:hypothetical protein